MDYVELNRSFAVIGKDEEPNLDIGRVLGRKVAGWLDWRELLPHWRVVLLAEAASGKTREFRHQAETLTAQGKAAFFARIENLADEGIEAALDPPQPEVFERWREGGADAEAWFFLDSVDEARLRSKHLDRALLSFVRGVGPGLDRARVYVSCRVSDWKVQEDRETVERLLPVPTKAIPPAPVSRDAALLAPILEERHQTSASTTDKAAESKQDALLVVQLVPLGAEQRRTLAAAVGVEQPDAFGRQIERSGLDTLADRPGDLLDLAGYWKTNGRFGSLAEMTEHSVSTKLAERDAHRPDSSHLAPAEARQGAERLAAALTLGKSWTVRVPGHDPDPAPVAEALDAAAILPEWSDAERNALLRRGVFAPSTYGRVRFHHRGTQEYLAGRWLARVLRAGCPLNAVWDLLFAERYGVRTLVPSLHAVAAWLAVDSPDLREEILKREPLVLLRHGDPRSLPLQTKERLLLAYAERHAAGDISDDRFDYRGLGLLAAPELGPALRESWSVNRRDEFHIDLLVLIREGAISTCADLARGVALDQTANESVRVLALQALAACDDAEGLAAAARWLMSNPDRAGRRLGPGFATVLFPRHLSVAELLALIESAPEETSDSYDGFGPVLMDLWRACPNVNVRERLLAGLADLVLAPPLVDPYRPVAARHEGLAEHLSPLGRDAVLRLGDAEPPAGLVRVLMAIERAEGHEPDDSGGPPLSALVPAHTPLQRRLFWADVEETCLDRGGEHQRPTRFWHAQIHALTLWQLGLGDLGWLTEDLAGRGLEADRQVALSAIVSVLSGNGRLEAEATRLRSLVAGQSELERDLDADLVPRFESEEVQRLRSETARRRQDREEKAAAERREAEAFWVRFRSELEAAPSVLRDRGRLVAWRNGAVKLYWLAFWLRGRTNDVYAGAAQQWRLLEEAFGKPVAEAYRDGMKALWRVTRPERPRHTAPNTVQRKWPAVLSLAGLGVEAAEDADWASHLSAAEAERAALHACLSEEGYPDWFDALAERHPAQVLPLLRRELRREWAGRDAGRAVLFSRFRWSALPAATSVRAAILEVIAGRGPRSDEMLTHATQLLPGLGSIEAQQRRLALLARRRLRAARAANDEVRLHHYLTMLFLVEPDRATRELADWLDSAPAHSRDARAEAALGTLFERDSPVLAGLRAASVPSLATLVGLAYRYVRPEDDRVHEGVYTPGPRDRAEGARSSLLGALLDRPGAEAYSALRALADGHACRLIALRFRGLAHGKAERDAELPVWTPAEVLDFERRHMMPAKTGEALLHVVVGVLADIQSGPVRADATSLPLLLHARNEDEVQKWLAEQMDLRSQGRFHVQREAHVAGGDKPDITVSSTAAGVQVAVEVKHGGKRWTSRGLERALTQQLAGKYLKPGNRRWGVLVVTHHGGRTWRDPNTRAVLSFQDVIARLDALAMSTVANRFGAISMRVCGIGAPSLGW